MSSAWAGVSWASRYPDNPRVNTINTRTKGITVHATSNFQFPVMCGVADCPGRRLYFHRKKAIGTATDARKKTLIHNRKKKRSSTPRACADASAGNRKERNQDTYPRSRHSSTIMDVRTVFNIHHTRLRFRVTVFILV